MPFILGNTRRSICRKERTLPAFRCSRTWPCSLGGSARLGAAGNVKSGTAKDRTKIAETCFMALSGYSTGVERAVNARTMLVNGHIGPLGRAPWQLHRS